MDETERTALNAIEERLLERYSSIDLQSVDERVVATARWRHDANAAPVTCIEHTLAETLERLLEAPRPE